MSENRDIRIGEQVRLRRKALGLTMKDVASALGVHFTTVGKLETGKMKFTADWLAELSKVLETTTSSLTNERFNPKNVTMVPLYTNIGFAHRDRPADSAQKLLEVPAYVETINAYGILYPDYPKIEAFSQGHWYIIIDPDNRLFKDGAMFAIRKPDSDRLVFGVLDMTNSKMYWWPDGEVEPLGKTPFEIVGRVVYQARSISPASGEHLAAFKKFAENYSGNG